MFPDIGAARVRALQIPLKAYLVNNKCKSLLFLVFGHRGIIAILRFVFKSAGNVQKVEWTLVKYNT